MPNKGTLEEQFNKDKVLQGIFSLLEVMEAFSSSATKAGGANMAKKYIFNFMKRQLQQDRETLRKEIEKMKKEGNPLHEGKGKCKCLYAQNPSVEGGIERVGLCLRCACDRLYAHQKGKLKALDNVLRLLEEKE